MHKEHQALRMLLSAVLVVLLGAGYVLASANAATSEAILNAPKNSKSPTSSPSASESSTDVAALSAINKAQQNKG